MILLKPFLKGGWDGGPRRAQQRRKDGGQIETPLTNGACDAGEDLLRIGATPRAIASTDLTGDDRGTNGLLRTPVECRAYFYAELSSRSG